MARKPGRQPTAAVREPLASPGDPTGTAARAGRGAGLDVSRRGAGSPAGDRPPATTASARRTARGTAHPRAPQPLEHSPGPGQGGFQGSARVVPTAIGGSRRAAWTHDRSRARRDGSGTRLRPTSASGRRAAGRRARRGCRLCAGCRARRRHRGRGSAPVPAGPAVQGARGGVRGARAAVRHGPGDLPDHARRALGDGRHRPHLLRLRMALRPVRRRGGERGPQALHRPRGRPGPGRRAVRAGRLRRVPVDAEQRQCVDLRRRPLPPAGGCGVLVAAARRPRPRPARRSGRSRRPAGGPGAAGGHRLPLLVA